MLWRGNFFFLGFRDCGGFRAARPVVCRGSSHISMTAPPLTSVCPSAVQPFVFLLVAFLFLFLFLFFSNGCSGQLKAPKNN